MRVASHRSEVLGRVMFTTQRSSAVMMEAVALRQLTGREQRGLREAVRLYERFLCTTVEVVT